MYAWCRYNASVKSDAIVPAIHARLASVLAPPRHTVPTLTPPMRQAPSYAPYVPIMVESVAAGWLDAERATRLLAFDDVFVAEDEAITFCGAIDTVAARSHALERVARVLAADGLLTSWRDERYAVAASFDAPPLMLLERAAARFFGIRTYAVHINGMVRLGRGDAMWLGRRSRTKAIDPGMLDNMVGGGIAAGATVRATAAKEAWEEAGIKATVADTIQSAGAVHIVRSQPDGLQRETIFVHDLWLDADFAPRNQDGEVIDFRRVALADVPAVIAQNIGDEIVTADASLVILDCLLRHGVISPDVTGYLALESLRRAAIESPP